MVWLDGQVGEAWDDKAAAVVRDRKKLASRLRKASAGFPLTRGGGTHPFPSPASWPSWMEVDLWLDGPISNEEPLPQYSRLRV